MFSNPHLFRFTALFAILDYLLNFLLIGWCIYITFIKSDPTNKDLFVIVTIAAINTILLNLHHLTKTMEKRRKRMEKLSK